MLEAFVNARVVHAVAEHLAAQAGLEFLELLLDGVGLLLIAYHMLMASPQVVSEVTIDRTKGRYIIR